MVSPGTVLLVVGVLVLAMILWEPPRTGGRP
jgi:hypothetical protein